MRDELPGVVRGESLGMEIEAGVRREGRESLPRRFGLGSSDLRFGVEHLPLEVALRDRVGVAEPDAAHARAGEVERRGRAEAPTPTSSTEAAASRRWPSSPIWGTIVCRA